MCVYVRVMWHDTRLPNSRMQTRPPELPLFICVSPLFLLSLQRARAAEGSRASKRLDHPTIRTGVGSGQARIALLKRPSTSQLPVGQKTLLRAWVRVRVSEVAPIKQGLLLIGY